MPEVHVFMAAGKTDDQKKSMMLDITNALVKNLDCPADAVTVQIVESSLQRLGLDRIGPEFVRRLHVTARFDDYPSGFGLPQIGLVHLGHEAGGAADHDDSREAQQLLRVGELLLGGEELRV